MIFVVGGGGKLKDTDAVLIVTVPTGSTVTATKGGTTLTPTMWVKAADNTLDCAIFSIPASQFDSTTPWTITAMDGTNTASTTVLITTNKEYEVTLSFGFYLFQSGSGFRVQYYSGQEAQMMSITDKKITTTKTGNSCATVRTQDKIDITSYGTLVFRMKCTNLASTSTSCMGLSTTAFVTGGNSVNAMNPKKLFSLTSGFENVILDISSCSGSYYIGFSSWATVEITDIYLLPNGVNP